MLATQKSCRIIVRLIIIIQSGIFSRYFFPTDNFLKMQDWIFNLAFSHYRKMQDWLFNLAFFLFCSFINILQKNIDLFIFAILPAREPLKISMRAENAPNYEHFYIFLWINYKFFIPEKSQNLLVKMHKIILKFLCNTLKFL